MTAATLTLPQRASRAYGTFAQRVDRLQPLFALGIRLYLLRVFFWSGLVKLHDWSITLALFHNEYHVPLLSPGIAALLGTAAELGLPLLLVAGIGSRAAALALFVFNIVAATSYPDLSPAGLKDHILWGALCAVLFFYGPGALSLDEWLARRDRAR
ncbi:MAG TPA: DoxX family protein [Casimicrobiaceae bacterium]|jgi:putative oxidoreductase